MRVVQSKEARFDGWFFTAVSTTGIYCRPSCPVVAPKVENMRFIRVRRRRNWPGSGPASVPAGRQPGISQWNQRADLVARAMRLTADGVVDRDGVPGLASLLGYSIRQIQR